MKIIKNYIFGFVIGILIFSSTVYANILLQASEVSYSNELSKKNVDNEKDAIDELYDIAYNKCPDGYVCTKIMTPVEGDGSQIGDIVDLNGEQFYVYGFEGEYTKLLAKYNLEVGSNCIYTTKYNCTPIENATGLQNERAKGYVESEYKTIGSYGVMGFTDTYYWDTSGLKPEYGTSYPAWVYDGNTYIKPLIDNYKTYLENKGFVIKEARVISYQELVELGCVDYYANKNATINCLNAPSFVYSTGYWSGTANNKTYMWRVNCGGGFGNYTGGNAVDRGIRPVILVKTSSINTNE